MSVPFSSQMICRNKTFVDITFWFNIWKGCRAPTGCVLMEKVHTAETKDPWDKINLMNLVALPTSAQWGPLAVVSWNPSLPKTRKDSDATNTLHGVSCTWQWQHQWPLQVQIYFSLQGILVDFGFTDQSDGGNRVEILKDSTSKWSWITLNLSSLKWFWNSPNLPNSSKVGWSYLFKSEQLDEKYLPYSLKCQDPSCLLRAWRNGCNFFILILLFAPVFSFCFQFPATHTKSMMQSKSSTHHQQETPPLQPPQNPQSLDLLLCTGLSLVKRCLAML